MSISDHFKYMFFSCKHPAAIISDPATNQFFLPYILQQLCDAFDHQQVNFLHSIHSIFSIERLFSIKRLLQRCQYRGTLPATHTALRCRGVHGIGAWTNFTIVEIHKR